MSRSFPCCLFSWRLCPAPLVTALVSVALLSSGPVRGQQDHHREATSGSDNQLDEYVVDVFEASNGKLWFATLSRGAACYDGNTHYFLTEADGLPSNVVTSFAETDDGILLIGTRQGLAQYDGNEVKHLAREAGLPPGAADVTRDREGSVWVNAGGWRTETEPAVYRLEQGQSGGIRFGRLPVPVKRNTVKSYSIAPGAPSFKLTDSKGNHWFAVDGYGVLRYDGKAFSRVSREDGLCTNNVTSIVEDRRGRIWFTCVQSSQPAMTGDGGLCVLEDGEFRQLRGIEALHHNDIYTLFEDQTGRLWIGATGRGVYRFDGDKLETFTTDRMDLTWGMGLQAACEDRNGMLWFGFSGGLFRFNGTSIINVTIDDLSRPMPVLETPENWQIERFTFPLSFAPEIPFTGVEDARFAPGWADPESDEHWGYKFVWQIAEDPDLDPDRLATLVKQYFDGLSGASRDVDAAAPRIPPAVVAFERVDSREHDFVGTARFQFRGEDVSLNIRVTSGQSGLRHYVVFALAPRDWSHEVWRKLADVKLSVPLR